MVYEPDLGQFAFGTMWGDYEPPEFAKALLDHLLDEVGRVNGNVSQGERDLTRYFEPVTKIPGIEARPYYWGDCTCGYDELSRKWEETHHHKDSCYRTPYRVLWEKYNTDIPEDLVMGLCNEFGIPYNDGRESAVHCTCGHKKEWLDFCEKNDHKPDCLLVLPNFKFEDVEIRWYKYPGRGMSTNKSWNVEEWVNWFNKCLEHLRNYEKEKLPHLYR